jgi:hypothetical protein
MRRLFKQTLIAAVFFGIVGGSLYFLTFSVIYPPSCTDGIRNQGEEGVDCGGPCPSCELKTLQPPVFLRTIYFPNVEKSTVDLAARIKNTNLSWGTAELRYTFTILDAGGEVSSRVRGRTHLLPGESRWVIELGAFSPRRAADILFEVATTTISWQKLKPFSQDISIIVRDVQFRKMIKPEVDFAELSGTVENKSNFALAEIPITVVLYDQFDRVLAFGKTVSRDLAPGSSQRFRVVWPTPFSGEVARSEVEASSNLLSDSTFIQRYRF